MTEGAYEVMEKLRMDGFWVSIHALTSFAALIYGIWRARNRFIWTVEVFSIEKLLGYIRIEVKNRINVIHCKKVESIDSDWFVNCTVILSLL